MFRTFLLSVLLIPINCALLAQQDEQALLRQIEQDDQTAVDAIAMYSPEIRKDIFEAARAPEVIVRLHSMQEKTKEVFTNLLTSYSKEEQEKIWNLTRYPALISEIAYGQKKTEGEINTILLQYPEEIHQIALEEGTQHYELLLQIAQKNTKYQADFEKVLRDYPPETANAYRDLIKMPEVLNTLYDNLQLTLIIGDLYKKDPKFVLSKTDSLNQVLTQQNAKETADWQQSLKDNPQAQKEYMQAAEQYAQDNGYEPADYSAPINTDVSDYPTYSYNWWFGYPSWYPYAYWDPYPYWYDWGFYYGAGGRPFFFGMPSSYFMNWYFYNPEHWNRYPELANHYYNYYMNHPGSRYSNSISRSVNNWRNSNRKAVNEDWDKDTKGRIQRFKEFGRTEMNTTRNANKNTDHSFVRQPATRVPASFRSSNIATPSINSQPAGKSSETHSNNNQYRNAQQYHQSTWQQVRPQTHYSPAAAPSRPMGNVGGSGGRRR